MSVFARVLLVVTVLWNLFMFMVAGDSYRFKWNYLIGRGIMPTVLIWGLYWIALGVRKKIIT